MRVRRIVEETTMADAEILPISFGKQSADAVYNQEVANLIDMLDDTIRQVTACPSASDRNWQGADLSIIRALGKRIDGLVTAFEADPQLYAPNSDRTEMNVAEPPLIMQPENPGALMIARHLARFRTQLRNGSSSKAASGFHPGELRLVVRPFMTKLDMYIAMEEARFASGEADYLPDVDDQDPTETTPGNPDNQ